MCFAYIARALVRKQNIVKIIIIINNKVIIYSILNNKIIIYENYLFYEKLIRRLKHFHSLIAYRYFVCL